MRALVHLAGLLAMTFLAAGCGGGTDTFCAPGAKEACYGGPAGTAGVGRCVAGDRTCLSDGSAFGPCEGEVLPATESCATPADDDCDGVALTCSAVNQGCNPTSGLCEDVCAPSMLGKSYQGCDFYPTVTASIVDPNFHFAVAVSNATTEVAAITVTQGAASIAGVDVEPNSVQIIALPWQSSLKGPAGAGSMPGSVRVDQGAFHLTSTRPVAVYQYSPLEYSLGGAYSYSNDASLLLPSHAWTGTYRAVARHHFVGMSGFLAVTASEDGTTVTLQPGPQGGLVKAGISGIGADGGGNVLLNRGDVIELVTDGGTSQSDPNDVTGTLVTADKPVQVIGGHQCTYVPDGAGYCDHLEESMLPLESLGTDYLVTSPVIYSVTPTSNMVRIMAIAPDVTLTFDPPQVGAPASIAVAGGWVEFQTAESFRVTGSGRIQVTQYMLGQATVGTGDPAMTSTVPTSQYRLNYLFHAPTNYEYSFVNITGPLEAMVVLDGTPLPALTAIGSTGFGFLRRAISNAGTGNHSLTSDLPVGISVYGYGQYTSYWYPGGLDLTAQ